MAGPGTTNLSIVASAPDRSFSLRRVLSAVHQYVGHVERDQCAKFAQRRKGMNRWESPHELFIEWLSTLDRRELLMYAAMMGAVLDADQIQELSDGDFDFTID